MGSNTLGSIIDLVCRRTRQYLRKDNFSKIIVILAESNSEIIINFYLNNEVSDAELAEVGARYNRIFSDIDNLTIHVLPYNTTHKDKLCKYTIWRQGDGFIGNPRLWTS